MQEICKTWDPRTGAYENASILEIYTVRTGIELPTLRGRGLQPKRQWQLTRSSGVTSHKTWIIIYTLTFREGPTKRIEILTLCIFSAVM